MDTLMHMRETKSVASDALLGLNYSKNSFAAGALPRTPLAAYRKLDLIRSHSSQRGRKGKEKK